MSFKLNTNTIFDFLFKIITRFFAFLVFLLLIAIVVTLIKGSYESLHLYGVSFLWRKDWDPVNHSYGGAIPILGTLLTSLIALLIAVPISFGIAIFLTEISPVWMRYPIGIAIEMLAAIPSIIYGMWGLFVFVPIFQENFQPFLISVLSPLPYIGSLFAGPPFGIGIFTASLILSIMIIPFISTVMRDVFELVPIMLKESAYGLGCTTWEVTRNIVLPFTKSGIIGGIMLGLGRALGETMAVTFVIGNTFQLTGSLFSSGSSIPSALANQFNEASGLQKSALLQLGLILFMITTTVLILSKVFLFYLSGKRIKFFSFKK